MWFALIAIAAVWVSFFGANKNAARGAAFG